MKLKIAATATFLAVLGCESSGFEGSNKTAAPVEEVGPETIRELDAVAEESTIQANNPITAETLNLCQDLERVSFVQPLNFVAQEDCNFGAGNNLGVLAGHMQAVREQKITVELPTGTFVCGIQLQSVSADLRYDDYLFFSLNDRILVASEIGWSNLLLDEGDLKLWGWEKLKGQEHAPIENDAVNYGVQYCLGDVDCKVPAHDETGAFSYGLDFSGLTPESQRSLQAGQQLAFGLAATGDDDADDCSFSDFNLSLTIQYVNIP